MIFDGLVLADGSGLSRANKVKPISQGEVFGRCDERENIMTISLNLCRLLEKQER